MKVIVAHPGKQHSFQMAIAMKKSGCLYKYITSVYNRSKSFTRILSKCTRGDLKKKIEGRKCSEIDDSDVLQINEFFVIITLFLNKIPGFNKLAEEWNRIVESSFYKKVMKYALKNKVDAVIVYNGYAKKYFELLDGSGILKIIDVSIAQRECIRDILEREAQESNLPVIRKEHFSYWNERMIRNDIDGCSKADYFLVPSDFVKNSLVTHNIDECKIRKIPYGVNINHFTVLNHKENSPLKLIYVGGISYRKGIHRLLEEISTFSCSQVQLYLAGAYDSTSSLYLKYKDFKNIHFLGFVTRDRLNAAYNEANVFVLPSFAEGMAMVGLEALSCGLPLICTKYTGVNDVIIDGKNGFVYDADDMEQLHSIIEWFLKNKSKIQQMSFFARETALNYTWEIYHKNVSNAICTLIKNQGRI